MIITEIKPLRKGKYALYLDGEYALSLDKLIVEKAHLSVNDSIDEDCLDELKSDSDIVRAKEKALYLLEYRARTAKELMDKLVPMFGEEAAESAVQRMEELGLIDDEAFARDYARTLLFSKKISPKSAVYELMKKGIGRDLAEEIIDECECDEQEQIRQIINRKYIRCLDDEKGRKKTINGLRAKGYCWSDIQTVLDEYDSAL